MRAMIITTGAEIVKGEVVDTHGAWISEQLSDMGVEVIRHVSVGDETEGITEVLASCAGACDLAFVTGGLGPTQDDLTAQAAADFAGVPLHESPEATESIADYFNGRIASVPASNKKQAMQPVGATCIPNPVGTAPGFRMGYNGTTFWFLPGVPREMHFLMTERVLPEILAYLHSDTVLVKRAITTFGLPESVVGELLEGLEAKYPGVQVGYRTHFPVIEVKLWAYDHGKGGLIEAHNKAVAEAVSLLGDHVVSDEGLSPAEAVAGKLTEAGKTLAVAESCTGGLIGSLLTDVAGSSDWFLLSAVTYANTAKMAILGVGEGTLETHGAVSEQTVKEMADGARLVAGAHVGVATSGIAGPAGGTDEKPVGTVWIGISTPHYTQAFQYVSSFKERHQNKRIFAFKALDLLRRAL